MSFGIATVTLASALANAGTVNFAYPTGTNQAFFTGANASTGHVLLVNDNDRYVSTTNFTVVFNASDITLTNVNMGTLPAGTRLRIQLDRSAFPTLTDNSGGTAAATIAAIGATYSQTEVRNAVASLAAAINRLTTQLRNQSTITD